MCVSSSGVFFLIFSLKAFLSFSSSSLVLSNSPVRPSPPPSDCALFLPLPVPWFWVRCSSMTCVPSTDSCVSVLPLPFSAFSLGEAGVRIISGLSFSGSLFCLGSGVGVGWMSSSDHPRSAGSAHIWCTSWDGACIVGLSSRRILPFCSDGSLTYVVLHSTCILLVLRMLLCCVPFLGIFRISLSEVHGPTFCNIVLLLLASPVLFLVSLSAPASLPPRKLLSLSFVLLPPSFSGFQ